MLLHSDPYSVMSELSCFGVLITFHVCNIILFHEVTLNEPLNMVKL